MLEVWVEMDRLHWHGWLATYQDTHPSTGQAHRRVTSTTVTNTSLMDQTASRNKIKLKQIERTGWRIKRGTLHGSPRSSNGIVLKMISFNECSEGWSCWTLEHSVQYNHPSLQWSRLIASKTVSDCSTSVKHLLFHFLMHEMFIFLCATRHNARHTRLQCSENVGCAADSKV